MIDLDHQAETHLQQLQVPAGVGLEAVMKAGRRRRRLRNVAVASGTFALTGVAALGLATIGSDSTTLEVAVESPSSDASVDAQREFFEALPERVFSEAANEIVPLIDGWTVQRASLDLSERFGEEGTAATYVLTSAASTVELTMLPGNVGSTSGTTVDLVRPDQTFDAWLDELADGTTSLTWNERPGVNSGTAVTVRGTDFDDVLAVAQAVQFVDRALEGAALPHLVDLGDGRQVILNGELGEAAWQISDNAGDVVVEINGQSPAIGLRTSKQGPFEAELTSISNEGLQVHLLELPVGATAATIVDGEFYASRSVDYGGATYAVVVIPPGKDAVAIRVEYGGSSLIVPLPLAPPSGWSTHHLSYETD